MVDDTKDSQAIQQDAAFMAAVVQGLMDVEQGKTLSLDEMVYAFDLFRNLKKFCC